MIALQVDSVLIVADTTRVRRAQLAATIEALERTGAHIAGVVLNRVKPRPHDDYYYVHDEGGGRAERPVPAPSGEGDAAAPAHEAETLEPEPK